MSRKLGVAGTGVVVSWRGMNKKLSLPTATFSAVGNENVL